jgi:hypothetical protein
MKWDSQRMRHGFLSGHDATVESNRERYLEDEGVLSSFFGKAARNVRPLGHHNGNAIELLARVEHHISKDLSALDLVDPEFVNEKLGLRDAIWQRFRGKEDSEVLRAALHELQHDRTFELSEQDDAFNRIDALVGPRPRFVVTGHTHLRRAIERKKGGWYYNTGTWARLLRVPKSEIENPTDFRKFYDALVLPTLADLDKAGYVVRQPTVARILSTNGQTRASLCDVVTSSNGDVQLRLLDKSSFPCS